MKKILTLVPALFSILMYGQPDQPAGIVTYEAKRKVQIKLPEGDDTPAITLPNEITTKKELLFTPEAALFRNIPGDDSETEAVRESTGGNELVIKIKDADEIIYSDLKARINTEQRDFMSRYFLITVPTDTAKWKLTGNSKTILNYNCLEAELTGTHAHAWFAPDLAVSCGPEGYCGLPGLILELTVGEERTYTALRIELKDPGSMERPGQGKKISRSEFDRLVAEKRKEMEQSGNNGVFIRREIR